MFFSLQADAPGFLEKVKLINESRNTPQQGTICFCRIFSLNHPESENIDYLSVWILNTFSRADETYITPNS